MHKKMFTGGLPIMNYPEKVENSKWPTKNEREIQIKRAIFAFFLL